ncbi:MAG: DNA polymerase III subunit chi [Gammaproteobacteria bacterium]|nr:DNA polymerase III subunit chi [Gammaproteobacteria bacterium]
MPAINRVDFYMIPGNDNQARLHFACKLTHKAWSLNNSVYLFSKNKPESQQLDNMLWQLDQGSFLPHGMKDDGFADQHPVLIGEDADPGKGFDLFINLTDQMPVAVECNQRVAEILHQADDCLTPGRARYKQYKTICQHNHCELNFHELGQT